MKINKHETEIEATNRILHEIDKILIKNNCNNAEAIIILNVLIYKILKRVVY
jgi:hypothetical protein